METNKLTLEELAWKLAELLPMMSQECPDCLGTGRPRFPCVLCRGTGRVPIAPDAGKLLDLMRGAGYYIEIRLGADSICAEVFPNIKSYKQLVNIEGKEFTLTVYEAAVKAMEASK